MSEGKKEEGLGMSSEVAWASLLGLISHCKMGAVESAANSNSASGLGSNTSSGHGADSELRGQEWNTGDQLGL